jgi:hypothetical protein
MMACPGVCRRAAKDDDIELPDALLTEFPAPLNVCSI